MPRARQLKRWPLAVAVATMLSLAAFPSLASRRHAQPIEKPLLVTLWVREVNQRALYWVNDKPVGRDSLGGLVRVIGPEQPDNVALTVILDSRVPINEIHEIDGMLDKIPIVRVRYFMFWVEDQRNMQELVLKAEFLPLPKSPR